MQIKNIYLAIAGTLLLAGHALAQESRYRLILRYALVNCLTVLPIISVITKSQRTGWYFTWPTR
jgi:hypothetical protein